MPPAVFASGALAQQQLDRLQLLGLQGARTEGGFSRLHRLEVLRHRLARERKQVGDAALDLFRTSHAKRAAKATRPVGAEENPRGGAGTFDTGARRPATPEERRWALGLASNDAEIPRGSHRRNPQRLPSEPRVTIPSRAAATRPRAHGTSCRCPCGLSPPCASGTSPPRR